MMFSLEEQRGIEDLIFGRVTRFFFSQNITSLFYNIILMYLIKLILNLILFTVSMVNMYKHLLQYS